MKILEEAKSTLERLEKVKAAAAGVDEAKALELLRIELIALIAPISRLSSNALIYRQEGVSLSQVPELKGVIDVVDKNCELFKATPKATTLRSGTRWTGLIGKLEAIVGKIRVTQASDWGKFFESVFFGGLPPASRFVNMAATPENKNAMERYRTAYQSFIKYRSQPPVDAADFDTLRLLSNQLTAIVFKEDVPDDVKKFLDATSSGAALDLLTPDVLKWLRENELLGNYTVRAKVH